MSSRMKVPITVELSESTLAAIGNIVEGEAPLAHKLEAYAIELIHQMASGAMILDSDALDRIRDANPEIEGPDDIVAACEAVGGVDSGEYVIRFPRDPALTANLVERADTNGITVQQLIRDVVSECLSRGYFFDIGQNSKIVFFSYPEAAAVNEILSTEDFCSTDVISGLEKAIEIINENAQREERMAKMQEAANIAATQQQKQPQEAPPPVQTLDKNMQGMDGDSIVTSDVLNGTQLSSSRVTPTPEPRKSAASKKAAVKAALDKKEAPKEMTVEEEEEANLFA